MSLCPATFVYKIQNDSQLGRDSLFCYILVGEVVS